MYASDKAYKMILSLRYTLPLTNAQPHILLVACPRKAENLWLSAAPEQLHPEIICRH